VLRRRLRSGGESLTQKPAFQPETFRNLVKQFRYLSTIPTVRFVTFRAPAFLSNGRDLAAAAHLEH